MSESCISYAGNIKCEVCNYVTTEVKSFVSHIKDKHNEIYSLEGPAKTLLKCNFCDFTTSSSSEITSHIEEYHNTESCNYCHFVASENLSLQDHTYQKHPELIMMHTMASQLNAIFEKFPLLNEFKTNCESLLNKVIEDQNVIKQELFLLKLQQEQSQSPQITQPELVDQPKLPEK